MDNENAAKDQISTALRAWMKHVGVTKSALATETGVARQTVDDILKGKRLASTESLLKLASRLGTTPGAILNGVTPLLANPLIEPSDLATRADLRRQFEEFTRHLNRDLELIASGTPSDQLSTPLGRAFAEIEIRLLERLRPKLAQEVDEARRAAGLPQEGDAQRAVSG